MDKRRSKSVLKKFILIRGTNNNQRPYCYSDEGAPLWVTRPQDATLYTMAEALKLMESLLRRWPTVKIVPYTE